MHEKIKSVFTGPSDKSDFWAKCCSDKQRDFHKVSLDERAIELVYKLIIRLMTNK